MSNDRGQTGESDEEWWDTVIVGAGQAGLALGQALAERGRRFLILEAEARLGEAWRNRWDSLELFTPARYDFLPGLPFPANGHAFPSKDEMADYLATYASRFSLPVRTGVTATSLSREAHGFALATGDGRVLARNVVVATGPNALPRIPGFAEELDPSIRQLHSSEYRNPSSVPSGDVLVVGAGTSGVSIGIELAASHRVYIAGRPTPQVPNAVTRFAGSAQWAFVNSVLTLRTPIGRRAAAGFHDRGAPLIRVSMKQLEHAGAVRMSRLIGTTGGTPRFDAGETLSPASIVWATGYRPDFGWNPLLPLDAAGWPIARRGVVESVPGLYVLGMPFQYALTSGLIGGVARDAAYLADRLVAGS